MLTAELQNKKYNVKGCPFGPSNGPALLAFEDVFLSFWCLGENTELSLMTYLSQ